MSKKFDRREFVIGTAALVAGASTATLSFGDEGGRVAIRVNAPERLEGLAGDELAEALHRSLEINVQDMGGRQLTMVAIRVRDGRPADSLTVGPLRVDRSQEGKFVPGHIFMPEGGLGELLPGDMLIPGGMFLPGDMFYPESGTESYASRVAVEALARQGAEHGLFFVVVAADPESRRSVASSGTALPLA